jgi:glycosyltransferase involved in cell wall biosynthesis
MSAMSPLLLSVVMPVFNAGRYLNQALESVLTQGVESLEVLCVHDTSSDNSGDILNDWASRDSRVILLKQKGIGCGAARNCALDHASGKYVMFVDADDLLLPGALKQILAEAEESDVLVFDFVKFRGDNHLHSRPIQAIQRARVVPRADLLRMMGVVWNKLVRRRWLEEAAIRFPEGMLFEDIPVHWKLIVLAKRVRYLALPLYALRGHAASTSANVGLRVTEVIRAFRIVEEFLRTSGNWEGYRDAFLPCQLHVLASAYDYLTELGADSDARATIEANLGPEQRASLHRLPLHWRDRDVFLSLDGHHIPKIRRQAFRYCRKVLRFLKSLLFMK